MKRFLTLCFSLFFLATLTKAQNTMQALFAGNAKLTFLGTDFTHTKFVGAAGFPDPAAIKNQHIKSWNSLLVLEPKKFSLQSAFKIKDTTRYETNIDDLTRINLNADVESNLTETPQTLTEADVKKIVAGYQLSPNEGVGIAYIAENMDKNKEEMSLWVTFIDLGSKKVLHTERVTGKAGGFGLRNYWAGAIYKVNKSIESKYYKQWEKQFK